MKKLLIAFSMLFLISCSQKIEKTEIEKTEIKKQEIVQITKLEISKENTPGYYEISGTIDQKTYDKFLKEFKSIKILVLDSKGGVYEYAKYMSAILRRMQVTTVVPNNATCESACTLLFQSGITRITGVDAKFMYHGMRYPRRSMNSYLNECPIYTSECEDRFEFMKLYVSKETLEYFFLNEFYGADRAVFERFKKIEVDPKWLFTGNLTGHKDLWITSEEAIHYKIANYRRDVLIIP